MMCIKYLLNFFIINEVAYLSQGFSGHSQTPKKSYSVFLGHLIFITDLFRTWLDFEHRSTFENGLPGLNQWDINQAKNTELRRIVSCITKTSLKLEARQTTNRPVYFDVAFDRTRLFVPQCHRRVVFMTLHGQVHGGSAATSWIIKARFVWSGMDWEIRR